MLTNIVSMSQTPLAHSRDGTPIAYRVIGSQGPGLVILHGSMEASHSHLELAKALSEKFTVYLPDRRGRGRSGPHRSDHVLRHEIEDLDAVLTATGSTRVFGVSSGAIVCLQAALALPRIEYAGLFEPPLKIDDSISTDWLPRFDEQIARGDIAGAMVSGMLGAEMGPAFMRKLPRFLLEALTSFGMRFDREEITMRQLAPTLHYDVALIIERAKTSLDALKSLSARVLLLGTTGSPPYLHAALDALEAVLPTATRIELPNAHHGVTGNTNRGGQPQRIAAELTTFYESRTA